MAKKMKNITMLFLINILCFFTVFGYSQTTRICPENIGVIKNVTFTRDESRNLETNLRSFSFPLYKFDIMAKKDKAYNLIPVAVYICKKGELPFYEDNKSKTYGYIKKEDCRDKFKGPDTVKCNNAIKLLAEGYRIGGNEYRNEPCKFIESSSSNTTTTSSSATASKFDYKTALPNLKDKTEFPGLDESSRIYYEADVGPFPSDGSRGVKRFVYNIQKIPEKNKKKCIVYYTENHYTTFKKFLECELPISTCKFPANFVNNE